MAKDQPDLLSLARKLGQGVTPDMSKLRCIVLPVLWQGQPGLQAKHRHRRLPRLAIGAFGMGDPLARQHPVHRAGLDPDVRAKAVAMMHPPFQKIGHGPQPDMRVRANVDTLPSQELCRSHLIEEDERTHHLSLSRRQRAADLEPAQIAGARNNHRLNRVNSVANRDRRVKDRVPAHCIPPFARKLPQVGCDFTPQSPRHLCAEMNTAPIGGPQHPIDLVRFCRNFTRQGHGSKVLLAGAITCPRAVATRSSEARAIRALCSAGPAKQARINGPGRDDFEMPQYREEGRIGC